MGFPHFPQDIRILPPDLAAAQPKLKRTEAFNHVFRPLAVFWASKNPSLPVVGWGCSGAGALGCASSPWACLASEQLLMRPRFDTQAAPSPPACACPAATPDCEQLHLIPIWTLAVASSAVGPLSPVAPIAKLTLEAQLLFSFFFFPLTLSVQCYGGVQGGRY